jgi:hypothetical protein
MLSGLQNKYGHFGEEKDPALSSDVAWWRRERSSSIRRCNLVEKRKIQLYPAV